MDTKVYQAEKTDFAAVGNELVLDVRELNTALFTFRGTYAFTSLFEVSMDKTNWFPIQVKQTDAATIATSHSTANSTRAYEASVRTWTWVRVRVSAFTSAGVHSVGVSGTSRPGDPLASAQLSGTNTVDTELPTAAALADATANPTAPLVGAANELFNNATWDRQRNNYTLALDTSAARTTSANGATGTNHNARGAEIFVNVTAVSGTTPTLAVRLQESYDGTNFRDVDTTNAQTASITGTGIHKLVVYPGVATAANASLNSVLPRTFRLAWTIGGTTPSFTFATHVNFVQ